MRIILHAGAHKTASTHLQVMLARRRAALGRRGVALFLPVDLRRDGLRLQDLLGLPPDDIDAAAHEARLEAAFGDAGRHAARLLISEENMLGTLVGAALFREGRLYARAPARLARVASLLPQGALTVALALRDPAEFLVSAYSQRLTGGRVEPFERFLAGTDPAALRWSDLAGDVLAALPAADLVVWRYEDYPAVAPAVLRAMLGDDAACVPGVEARANPGLSARAHAAAMTRLAEFAGLEPDAARARIAALRAAYPRGDDHPAFQPLDAATRARSAQAYAADVARIAAMPRVSLLRP